MDYFEELNGGDLTKYNDADHQISQQDYKEIGQRAEKIVNVVSNVINNSLETYAQVKELSAKVEIECKRMELALDALVEKARYNLDVYKASLPTLDAQFSSCQQRMDRLIDKAMEFIVEDLTEENILKQEALMTLIEITNNSLNTLIAKLIPRY